MDYFPEGGLLIGFYRSGQVLVDSKKLSTWRAPRILKHKPTPLGWSSWAQSKNGKADLALSLLLHFVSKKKALWYYQAFQEEIVNSFEDDFMVPVKLVTDWIEKNIPKG